MYQRCTLISNSIRFSCFSRTRFRYKVLHFTRRKKSFSSSNLIKLLWNSLRPKLTEGGKDNCENICYVDEFGKIEKPYQFSEKLLSFSRDFSLLTEILSLSLFVMFNIFPPAVFIRCSPREVVKALKLPKKGANLFNKYFKKFE